MNTLITDHAIVDGGRIAYGILGAGAPVVLLHGTPSSSYIWRDIVPILVQSGYRVHVYDLLGYGLSERPWDLEIDTSVSGQVPILETLLSQWGLKDFHLVAHDIGGGIAQRLAAKAKERIRSLTLIDTVSFDSWPSTRTRQQMQAGLEALIKSPDVDHRAHFRDWLLSTVEDKERFAEASLETYLDYISNPIGQASLFQHQVRHYDPRHTNDLTPHLAELASLPVQVIWGAQDGWQVQDWAHKLHEAIPGSRLHLLENCGHFAMEDQPDAVAELIITFLAQVSHS